jgi:transposase
MTFQLILPVIDGSVDLDSQHPKAPAGCNRQGLSETTDAIARSQSKQLSLWAIAEEKARPAMNRREEKGREIAAHAELTRDGELWIVPSQTGRGTYNVAFHPEGPSCTCPDYAKHHVQCKHIHAVEYAQRSQGLSASDESPPKHGRRRKTYPQNWTAYNLAQTREKAHLQELLYALCQGIEEPLQTKGRPRLPLSEVIFSAVFKVYSTVSGRRFMSDLTYAQSRGYITKTPHFNSIYNYFEMESLTPYLHDLIQQSAQPLKAIEERGAVDSSGFRTRGFVRWFNARYGKEQVNHDWLKLHLICGVKTNIVIRVEASDRHANDSPFFEPLVNAAALSGFNFKEVSADKAYSSRPNLRLVEKHGGVPYIVFKDNARGDSKCPTWNKMFHYYSLHREEFMEHYHKRSNVESTFSMIKAKFGEAVRSKSEAGQINEALCKVLCHNLCCVIQSMYEFDIVPTFCEDLPFCENSAKSQKVDQI